MMKHYAKRTVQIITAAMMMLAAPAMAWGEEVKYISGDEEKIIEATVLTNEETTLGTDGAKTWYVVPEGGVTYDQGLTLIGDVYLILRDGATMTVGTSENDVLIENITFSYSFLNTGGSINIFAQSTGENMGILKTDGAIVGANGITINGGKIEATSSGEEIARALFSFASPIIINGGDVTATAEGTSSDCERKAISCGNSDIIINGGKVTAKATGEGSPNSFDMWASNNISIFGGQVTAMDKGIFAQGSITLSWSKGTDFIQASSIRRSDDNNGTISLLQGKNMAYLDGENDDIIVSLEGTITDPAKLDGKKLTPPMVKLFDTGKTNLWMTWCDQGVWVMPKGCTACKVSGISTDGKSVMIEPIENGEVPGYTPVLIKREYQNNSYYATFSETGKQPSSSNEDDSKGWVFKGNYYTNSMGGLYGIDAHADKVSYILLNDEFVRVYASDGEIQPRRCWLTVTPAATNTAGARRLSIGSANSSGGTTAIRTMDGDSSDAASDALWHTLDGRTLTTRPTQKGIYIHQGNKIIIK